jgi:hypothetical protein
MSKAHAKLSASGSTKWLNCPGSVNAEVDYPDSTNQYAEEGTLAHELADLCLKNEQEASYYVDKKIEGTVIQKDMAEYVQEYLDYVLSHETSNTALYAERQVDYSNVVPEGFGTLDAAVLDYDTGICHIFDLKYGKGVAVDAFENTQGQMYALGMLNEFDFLGVITSFRIHIVQPRKYNISHWDISVKDLNVFSEWVTERAELALTKDAPRVPGVKQCEWCKAQGDCKALYDFTSNIIAADFDNIEDDCYDINRLSDQEKKNILDNKPLIEKFVKKVEADVFDLLDSGKEFAGYKLVEGRSNRQWKEEAEDALVKKIGEEAYNKKLIGLGDAAKKVGKDLVDELTFKPEAKPTLAPETDKRKAIVKKPIEEEFDAI